MTFSTIVYEPLEGVARITLNRPERANALNQTMLAEIGMALDRAEQDPAVRALVVQGAGGAFSSGFDLKEQMERVDRRASRPGSRSCAPTSRPSCASGARSRPSRRSAGLPRRRLRARARLRPDDRRGRRLLRRARAQVRRRDRRDAAALAGRPQGRQGDHPLGRGSPERRAGGGARDRQPRAPARRGWKRPRSPSPVTSRRSTPTSSGAPSARSTAASRREVCSARSRRRSRSTC